MTATTSGPGHLHGALHLVCAHQQAAEDDRGWDGAQRVQLAEQRSDDAAEAVTARQPLDHAVVDARGLDCASQTGKGAAEDHG